MAYEVVYTESFRRELDTTLRYYVSDLDLVQAADKLASAVESTLSVMADNPEAKAISRKQALKEAKLREWFVRKYVIAYRFDGKRVYLEHFFHQSQDFENLL